jgi:hypothetical protein
MAEATGAEGPEFPGLWTTAFSRIPQPGACCPMHGDSTSTSSAWQQAVPPQPCTACIQSMHEVHGFCAAAIALAT